MKFLDIMKMIIRLLWTKNLILFIKKENSFLIDTFYSQIIITFTCKCNYRFYSYQKIIEIPLKLPEDKFGYYNLDILLDLHFKNIINVNFTEPCKKFMETSSHKKDIKINIMSRRLFIIFQKFIELINLKMLKLFISPLDWIKLIILIMSVSIIIILNIIYMLFWTIKEIWKPFIILYINITEVWFEFNDKNVF